MLITRHGRCGPLIKPRRSAIEILEALTAESQVGGDFDVEAREADAVDVAFLFELGVRAGD